MKENFNTIGIDSNLDWERIAKLLRIGLFAGIMVLIGDMLLGMEKALSPYITLSDGRIFWSSFLGMIGIPLEGLCYFGIYRLMAGKSPKHAHAYRSGILGFLIFGAFGVHVPCLSSVFFLKYMYEANPENAHDLAIKYGSYFLLPGIILFFIFWVILCAVQISAFVKGMTPYPKWCWIFSIPVGMILVLPFAWFDNQAWANALTAGYTSIGNIWMFGGLLFTMKLAKRKTDVFPGGRLDGCKEKSKN